MKTTNLVRFLRQQLLLLLSAAAVSVTPYGLDMLLRHSRCGSGWIRRGPRMARCTSSSGQNDEIPVDHHRHHHPTDQNEALVYPVAALERIDRITTTTTTSNNLWSDRRALQHAMTLSEKGWQVSVEWKVSSTCNGNGIGVFATQFIAAGTILRVGIRHRNVFPLNSVAELESFCFNDHAAPWQYEARLRYVQDYLWGYYPSDQTDERGYPHGTGNDDERFFGMWIPGNGLNHHPTPNTVYRNQHDFFTNHSTTTNVNHNQSAALFLMALTDIKAGDELFDDYKRHGRAPPLWLKNYAAEKNMTLNFADCNDFVV